MGHFGLLRETFTSTPIIWGVLFIKVGTVLTKLPYVIIHDDKEKTCLLVDVVLPHDSNVNTKETEKLRKYQDLWRSGTAGYGKWGQKLCQL